MLKSGDSRETEVLASEVPPKGRAALLQERPWLTFLLPLLVFMVVGTLEPSSDTPGGTAIGLAIPYAYYPWLYILKIALVVAVIFFVLPGYREFPFKISPLSILVGVVGIVVWVGLCEGNLEQRFLLPWLEAIKLDGIIDLGARSAFNPLQHLAAHPVYAYAFLTIRFVGLVVVVALIEEFFLRGFLMRFVIANRWWEVPIGKANTAAVVMATLVPMAMHPAELLAACVWFSMVTWLFLRTRNIWDCVAAHATTNLLLGIYVVISGHWRLM